jgi:hypothetical protein
MARERLQERIANALGVDVTRPGPCASHLRLAFGEPPQWFDADMNPFAGPA